MTMTVVITGASGYIGRHLVARLFELGTPHIPLSRGDEPGRFRNLRDGSQGPLIEHLAGASAVVHLAGRLVDDPLATVSAYVEPNVLLTDQVLGAAVESGVDAVVHVSSRLVYPSDLASPAVEDRDARPDTAYGLSKLWSEDVVRYRTAGSATSAVSLRVAQVTGGDHPGLGVINTFLEQARLTGSVSVRGAGVAVRELVHVNDVVEALLAALRFRGSWLPVNVGGTRSLTVAEIAAQVAECVGLGADAVRHIAVDAEDRSIYALDATRRRAVLAWEPTSTVADIIAEIVQRKEQLR